LLLGVVPKSTIVVSAPVSGKVRGGGMSKEEFVQEILQRRFDERFRKVRGYQWLFESNETIVYFQNFDKADSPKLWYRINQSPLNNLMRSSKKAFICFTNPADAVAYLLPLEDIQKRSQQVGWNRGYYEVNLDVPLDRWVELDWNIEAYKFAAE
jgi:hypothetical protein